MAQNLDKNDDVLAQAVASMDIEAEPTKPSTVSGPTGANNLVTLADLIPSTYRPNRYSHPSAMENNGAFVQIMSHNCNDAANVLGCIRLPVSDHNEVQYYLATHRREILVEAVAMLDQHFKDCQSATAVLEEDLIVDDYSLTFMVASVNENGRAFNNGRKEGGLWMLNYPSYLKVTRASFYAEEDPNLDSYQLTINAYIHLNEPHRRQRAVVKRHLEESFAKVEKNRMSREIGNKGKRSARDVSLSRAQPLDRQDTSNPGPAVQPVPELTPVPGQQQPLQPPSHQPQPATVTPPSPDQQQQLAQAPAQPPANGPSTPVVPQPTGQQIQPLMLIPVPAPPQPAPAQQPLQNGYPDNAQQPPHPPGYPQPQYQPQPQGQKYKGSPKQHRHPEQRFQSQPFQQQPFQQPFQQFQQPQQFQPPQQQFQPQQQQFAPQQQQQFPPQQQFQQQQQQYQGQQQYRPRRNNRKGPYDGSRSASAHAPRNYDNFPPMPQGTQPANPNWSGPVPVVRG